MRVWGERILGAKKGKGEELARIRKNAGTNGDKKKGKRSLGRSAWKGNTLKEPWKRGKRKRALLP